MKVSLLLALLTSLALAGCGPAGHDRAATTNTAAAAASAETKRWHCPMHPTFIKDGPGSCAICGMNLVPVEAAVEGGAHIAGRTAIMVAPDRQRQIGVGTVVVSNSPVERTIRAPAVVEADPGRIRRVAPRFGGYVEELFVTAPAAVVTNGQPLLRVFSAEVQAARAELAVARRNGSADLVTAAEGRLAALGLDADPTAAGQVVIRAPQAGVVTEFMARAGQAFMPGENFAEIADFSRVWVRASLFERDQPLVKTGQHAMVETATGPTIVAAVTAILPAIQGETRTLDLRLEVANPDGLLRPGQWAIAEFDCALGEHLTVPAAAILDTGERTLAFVQTAADTFEPREVAIGDRGGDLWTVREGLRAGERVVAKALFLLDSESQLKAAILGQSHE